MYDHLGVADGDIIADISILQLGLSWGERFKPLDRLILEGVVGRREKVCF
jgi:hypothetical protein